MQASFSPKAQPLYFISKPSLLGHAKTSLLPNPVHICPNNTLHHLQLFHKNKLFSCFSAACTSGDSARSCPYQAPFLLESFLLSQVCISIREGSVKHQLDMKEQRCGCQLCAQLGRWLDTGILHRTQPSKKKKVVVIGEKVLKAYFQTPRIL